MAAASSLPHFAIGQSGPPASLKANLAFIGGGGIAKVAFQGCEGENYVAICDIDDERAAEYFNKYPNARRYKDCLLYTSPSPRDS